MSHKRTSFFGGVMIVGAVLTLIGMLANGTMPTAEQWVMFGGAIVAGAGHIAAADGKNVPAAAPAPQPPVAAPPPPGVPQ